MNVSDKLEPITVCQMIPGHLYRLDEPHQHYNHCKDVVFICTKKMCAGYVKENELGYCLINIDDGGLWQNSLEEYNTDGYVDLTKEIENG